MANAKQNAQNEDWLKNALNSSGAANWGTQSLPDIRNLLDLVGRFNLLKQYKYNDFEARKNATDNTMPPLGFEQWKDSPMNDRSSNNPGTAYQDKNFNHFVRVNGQPDIKLEEAKAWQQKYNDQYRERNWWENLFNFGPGLGNQ